MSGGLIFTTLKHESIHVKMVYTIADQLANYQDTMWNDTPIAANEFITSIGHMAEYCSITKGFVRSAFDRLEELGIFKIDASDRRFTRIRLLSRNTVSGTVSNTAKLAKNKHESKSTNTVSDTVSDHRVLGVNPVLSQSSGVDVSPGLIQEKATRARPLVHNSSQGLTTTAQYDTAVARAPSLPDVVMHIDRLFADEISPGNAYPWSGSPSAATILATLIVKYRVSLVLAAAEKFFAKGHPWTEERSWAINEFNVQFARLIAMSGVTKRAAIIVEELQNHGRPTTPRELREQIALQRRRKMGDYDPAEELREKVPVG